MRRRALLAALAGLTAGCSSGQSDSTRTLATPANVPTEDSPTAAMPTTATPGRCTETTTQTPEMPVQQTPDITVPDRPPGETADAYRVVSLDSDAVTNREGASARYRLEPTDIEPTDVNAPVVSAIDDIEPIGVRAAVREALDGGGLYLQTVSCELRTAVERVDVFTDEGTAVGGLSLVTLDSGNASPIRFDVELVDDTASADHPAVVDLSLVNDSIEECTVMSGSIPPFGVVDAERTDGERVLLWKPYEDEGCYRFTEEEVVYCAVGSVMVLAPGESTTSRYELRVDADESFHGRTDPPGTGAYQASGSVGVRESPDAPELSLDYAFTFGLAATTG